VRLLLDTHILIWALSDVSKLSSSVADMIRDPRNEVFVSAVTAWELAIKQSLGKIVLPENAEDWLPQAVEALQAEWLAIHATHALAVRVLPWHHRDPFDRLLVAQASTGFAVVTQDRAFADYDVSVVWN